MRKAKVIAGMVSILIGLILVSIPFYHEWQTGKEIDQLTQAVNLISNDARAAEVAEEFEYAKDIIWLEIPDIDLNQMILPETTEETLNLGLTQIKPNQVPGEGNFTVAGHRGYRGDRFFRNLPDVPIGATVNLIVENKTYTYEITSSEIIEPTQTDILLDEEGKNEITLITCTVDGKQRIALKGDLVM
ncbi:class D sortase [Alkalicoccobacillus porphyridii]|uniref:Class D sortase n=1 Tax=Alkalicoccobacillus porphyridii TaxID=2597270 RepID=A0A554A4D6_9BACI|nr:class D sortase [Alkalicoccobacillus porphyridii]TSB48560.1 class D sortase [Alkalicoccobacillus porphyridii]